MRLFSRNSRHQVLLTKLKLCPYIYYDTTNEWVYNQINILTDSYTYF
jgi:hypothetical protein